MKYVRLPNFQKAEDWSSWEGETMHGASDLPNGTYCETYAIWLMKQLIRRYLHNVKAAGADMEYHRKAIISALDGSLEKEDA